MSSPVVPTVPDIVVAAERRAAEHSFVCSCAAPTGPLLATLAAAVRPGGRVLELGTGVGVGTAWIVSGLEGREDVEVVTIERDDALADVVRNAKDPDLPVTVLTGDVEAVLPGLGTFDLVFADAEGGKWSGLDLTIAALAPGGVLLVDDMDLARYSAPEHRAAVTRVRETLLTHPSLVSVELATGTGHILSSRRPR
ncbi:Predicted O-methyltransferase YrrM [Quadrisphaera granulorum]|uniref:Putative O-methyltransferase YrrM n=1 Tax=Quadrisphaera granulorum TaxID=317664 RepID=A0A316A978_9ACTN|nr:class I SAM-dependent methyltransferase [Quadrisphaera granulorum]PWJ53768.1 putative O-methyltransferase YrrM [Quadrisphaera granulorum]SZE96525.1 Predicted O-methyltransferase YrrM [Quadrisphaera granulorum]